MLLVCLTGGLGSGKTTVGRMLQRRGAVLVEADELARRALDPGAPAFDRAVDLFGRDVLRPDGSLDRPALARAVFADEAKRRALEAIVHPEVFRGLAGTLDALRGTDAVVVFDAPLVVETGFHRECDVTVVVSAPADRRLERVARGRGMSEEEARARMAAQATDREREAAADVVVRNDGTLEDLDARVGALWDDLRRRATHRQA